ncbi:acyltransferase, partial [Helicobacter ganmani]
YDISTLKRVNQAGDVKLGNHIWVCEDVTCLNNSSVADNCVIATKSLVTKHLTDENCVYGGIPAKKIKSNINWDTQ